MSSFLKKIERKIGLHKIDLRKIVWFLGNYSFWVVIVLITLSILLGAILFYQYAFLAKNEQASYDNNSFLINKNVSQKVLSGWDDRSKRSEDFMQETYTNPF